MVIKKKEENYKNLTFQGEKCSSIFVTKYPISFSHIAFLFCPMFQFQGIYFASFFYCAVWFMMAETESCSTFTSKSVL